MPRRKRTAPGARLLGAALVAFAGALAMGTLPASASVTALQHNPSWLETPGTLGRDAASAVSSAATQRALAALAGPTVTEQVADYLEAVHWDDEVALIALSQAEQQAAASAQSAAVAQAAAAQAASDAADAAAAAPTGGGDAGGVWADLRQCESGGNYADDTGNGYYGAYQFALSTWQSLGFSGYPNQAPPAVQDAAAQELQARSGWGQWPACSAKLGL